MRRIIPVTWKAYYRATRTPYEASDDYFRDEQGVTASGGNWTLQQRIQNGLYRAKYPTETNECHLGRETKKVLFRKIVYEEDCSEFVQD